MCVVHPVRDARRGYLGTAEAEGVTRKEVFLMIAIGSALDSALPSPPLPLFSSLPRLSCLG